MDKPINLENITQPLPKSIGNQIRAAGNLVEAKGPKLALRMIGSAILLDMPGETDGETLLGGVVVPEASRKKMQQIRDAIILAVGPDVTPMTGLKAGDRVLVRRVAVEQVAYDGHSYWITGPQTIVAALPETGT